VPEMGIGSSSSSNPESIAMALAKAKEVAASAPVVVFSKSYCPFCTKVKQLFTKLGASFKAIELDVEGEWTSILFLFSQFAHFIYLDVSAIPRAGTQSFR
jgi:thiol-disulfide isomerase/thioredoxin